MNKLHAPAAALLTVAVIGGAAGGIAVVGHSSAPADTVPATVPATVYVQPAAEAAEPVSTPEPTTKSVTIQKKEPRTVTTPAQPATVEQPAAEPTPAPVAQADTDPAPVAVDPTPAPAEAPAQTYVSEGDPCARVGDVAKDKDGAQLVCMLGHWMKPKGTVKPGDTGEKDTASTAIGDPNTPETAE